MSRLPYVPDEPATAWWSFRRRDQIWIACYSVWAALLVLQFVITVLVGGSALSLGLVGGAACMTGVSVALRWRVAERNAYVDRFNEANRRRLELWTPGQTQAIEHELGLRGSDGELIEAPAAEPPQRRIAATNECGRCFHLYASHSRIGCATARCDCTLSRPGAITVAEAQRREHQRGTVQVDTCVCGHQRREHSNPDDGMCVARVSEPGGDFCSCMEYRSSATTYAAPETDRKSDQLRTLFLSTCTCRHAEGDHRSVMVGANGKPYSYQLQCRRRLCTCRAVVSGKRLRATLEDPPPPY